MVSQLGMHYILHGRGHKSIYIVTHAFHLMAGTYKNKSFHPLNKNKKNRSIPRDSTKCIHDRGHTSLSSQRRGAFELHSDLIHFLGYVGNFTSRSALHSSWQGP